MSEIRARKEILRFIAERHDGYLEFVLKEWMNMNPPSEFNGDTFHKFSIMFSA